MLASATRAAMVKDRVDLQREELRKLEGSSRNSCRSLQGEPGSETRGKTLMDRREQVSARQRGDGI